MASSRNRTPRSLQALLDLQDDMPEDIEEIMNLLKEKQPPEIRIAIVGKTGSGKSATGSTILGEDKFKSKLAFKSETSKCAVAHAVRFGKKIVIADTPGVCDKGRKEKDIQEELKKCLMVTTPGPHAFILVINIARYTKEENDAVQHFIKYFGEGIYKHFIVLFTWKDQMDRENTNLKDLIRDAPEELKEFISRCQGRVIAFDNTLKGEEQNKQVQELLDMINDIVLRNSGKYYTHEMYQKAEEITERRSKDMEEAEKDKLDEIRRKMTEENEKECQRILSQKELEIEKQKSENKQRCKELEKDKLRKEYDEKNKENQRKLQACIDAKNRDQCRREVTENSGSELLAGLGKLLFGILSSFAIEAQSSGGPWDVRLTVCGQTIYKFN